MLSRDLYVVLIRVLGLYVLTGNALYQWIHVLGTLIANLDHPVPEWFTSQLVQAVPHTVVGLYFLICAEQVARFVEMLSRSSSDHESEEGRRPGDEPTN